MKELLFTIKSGLVFRQLDCDGDEVWLFFARDSTANPEFESRAKNSQTSNSCGAGRPALSRGLTWAVKNRDRHGVC